MESHEAIVSMKEILSEISRKVSEAQGENKSIDYRKSELQTSVGLAKGRLDKKKDVEKFIEDMQSEAHAKRVGDFERLLTALVTEVLPGEKPIGLELDIERGQPSLDIVSRISADLCEDIFEDQGGALTNIVVLGLRLISVIRSGMRKFIVLDEPDCWVKNDRIPAFYSVVKEAARKVGVQCFVISHHDTSQFEEGISVSSLNGRPDLVDGVHVENNPKPYQWGDDEDGLRYIRLVNFQGYVDETLHLQPGVNALVGDNNIGKSSFVRAFRAVFYADVRDSLIRRDEKECIVEIGLKAGKILQFTRPRKKSANWRLLNSKRELISVDFDTSSRKTPDWAVKETGIGPISGLDPHVVKQKTPIFLLDKPGSTRAAVLSIGSEATHMREMVGMYKKLCSEDGSISKNGELEMFRLTERAKALAPIIEFIDDLEKMRSLLVDVEKNYNDNSVIQDLVDKFNSLHDKHSITKDKISSLIKIPSKNSLIDAEMSIKNSSSLKSDYDKFLNTQESVISLNSDILSLKENLTTIPELISSQDTIKLGKSVKENLVNTEMLRNRIKLLLNIPKEPVLSDNASLNDAIQSYVAKKNEVTSLNDKKDDLTQKLLKSRESMESILSDIEGLCPLCGNTMDHNHVLTSSKG